MRSQRPSLSHRVRPRAVLAIVALLLGAPAGAAGSEPLAAAGPAAIPSQAPQMEQQASPQAQPSQTSAPVPAAAASSVEPSSSNADVERAQSLVDQGKPDEAVTLLNSLAQRQPEPAGVEALLGRIFYQKHEYVAAAQHLTLALKQKPDDGESTQLLGLSDYLLGHVADAIPLLEKVQSSLPKPDVTGSYLLGNSFLQTFHYDQARAAFAHMFSVPPASAQAHLILAQMMIRAELEEKAVPELRQALAMDPRLPMAHFLLGEVELYKSQVPEALEDFRQELALNPILWLAYWRMGDAYTRLEKWNDAEQALKQAVWLNENFTGPYVLLGKVELKKGDPQVAAEFLERALKMDPKNYLAHYILGTAYKQMGRDADAQREFGLSESLRSVGGKPQ
jgi:tetratricopeptide (TPR) repeat protein